MMRIIKYYFLFFITIAFLASCSKDCSTLSPECEVKCAQIPEPDLCQAAIPRYFFNNETKKCELFIWGGCSPVVPFVTLEECMLCGCK